MYFCVSRLVVCDELFMLLDLVRVMSLHIMSKLSMSFETMSISMVCYVDNFGCLRNYASILSRELHLCIASAQGQTPGYMAFG